MTDKDAGKKGDTDLLKRSVPIIPLPAIERVHVFGVASDDTNRDASPDYLAVSGQVSAHAEISLRSAGMHAKPGNNLIKNQSRASLLSDFSQLMHKFPRLQIQTPTLHRLDQDG